MWRLLRWGRSSKEAEFVVVHILLIVKGGGRTTASAHGVVQRSISFIRSFNSIEGFLRARVLSTARGRSIRALEISINVDFALWLVNTLALCLTWNVGVLVVLLVQLLHYLSGYLVS